MMLIIFQFLLFTLVEGFIDSLFFYKLCNSKKFTFLNVIILSCGTYIISSIFPPLIYQFITILWMGLVASYINKNFTHKYFVNSLFLMCSLLCLEMGYGMIYEFLKTDNLLNNGAYGGIETINGCFYLFFRCIPIKFVEILLIIKGGKTMKHWLGGIVKK